MSYLSVLNVGDGDTKYIFDPKKPEEVKRSKRVIEDMLKRGFVLLVQVGTRKGEPLYQRAKAFDPKRGEYIVSGVSDEQESEGEAAPKPKLKAGNGRRKKKVVEKRLPAARTRAVALPRNAGG